MVYFSIPLFLFLSSFIKSDGLKILGLLPVGSKSHWIVGHEIIKSLVDAGHDATVITTYPLEDSLKNYEEISISEVLDVFDKGWDPFTINKIPTILGTTFLHMMGNSLIPLVIEHENVQKLMKRKEKFDICFLEIFHLNAFTGIFDHFDCIYIPYTTSTVSQWVDVMTSNISPASYIVNPMLPYSGKMNFAERFWNTLYGVVEDLSYHFYHMPKQRALYQKYFPNAKRSLDQMINGPALTFISNHISISGARPYLPNMIEIGGIHIQPKKSVPDDIQAFLDSAADGVVLFSMGSIVKSKNFPENIRTAFIKAFGKLKQKVLWKYENDTLPDKPENVMIRKWIPQRDVLAHPNVKLFISHGGYLGLTEATAEGVPIIGIALYGDQGRNIAISVEQKRGIKLDLNKITEENVLFALNEILNNSNYKENAVIISKRFHDRLMTPQQQIVFWTEYVARHNGAPFLRIAGCDMNMIEFYSIDVYCVIFGAIFILLYIKFYFIKFTVSKLKSKLVKKAKVN